MTDPSPARALAPRDRLVFPLDFPSLAAARPAASASARAEGPRPAAWIGVSHDLSLADAKARTPVCQCLAAAAGSPSDPAFAWRSGMPAVDEDTIAVAISGDGVPCSATVGKGKAAHAPLPSIAGMERVGDDLVVDVEEAVDGRPTVRGLLAKRPGPTGSVIVRARSLPFGRPEGGGKGTCRIPVGK
jgi:hypothetical protein